MLIFYTWKSKESWCGWTCVCCSCGSRVMPAVVEAKPFIAIKMGHLNPFNLQLSHLSLLQETKFPPTSQQGCRNQVGSCWAGGLCAIGSPASERSTFPHWQRSTFLIWWRGRFDVFSRVTGYWNQKEGKITIFSHYHHLTLTGGSRSTFTLPSNVIFLVYDNVNSTDSDIFQSDSGLF